MKIELVFADKDTKINAAKILREYVSRPYRELLEAVVKSEPVFITELLPEQFYDGIKDVVSVINNLDSVNIPYTIYINGELDRKETIFKIDSKVKNITLKDFR